MIDVPGQRIHERRLEGAAGGHAINEQVVNALHFVLETLARSRRERLHAEQQVGVGAAHDGAVTDAELVESRDGLFHDGQVRLTAHDNGDAGRFLFQRAPIQVTS